VVAAAATRAGSRPCDPRGADGSGAAAKTPNLPAACRAINAADGSRFRRKLQLASGNHGLGAKADLLLLPGDLDVNRKVLMYSF
jgi:hypothetical protein